MSGPNRPRHVRVSPSSVDAAYARAMAGEEFVTSPSFAGDSRVLIACATLPKDGNTHYLNKLAVRATARWGERAPAGRICHCELLLQPRQGVWYRGSINKLEYAGEDSSGKPLYRWGTVHLRRVDPGSMADYSFFQIRASRAQQFQMWRFLTAQVGGEFNLQGYATNFVLGTWIGQQCFDPSWMFDRKGRWFCTELIVCALQAAGLFEHVCACQESPNSLYRLALAQRGGCGAVNPATVAYIGV